MCGKGVDPFQYARTEKDSLWRKENAAGKQYSNIEFDSFTLKNKREYTKGEADANDENVMVYEKKMENLMTIFRDITKKDHLPILIAEIGGQFKYFENWKKINEQIKAYTLNDKFSRLVITSDLKDKGDKVHFNSKSQRIIGRRFAKSYLKIKESE